MTTKPKTINFDLPKHFDNNTKNETDFIIKHNEILAEDTMKIKIRELITKYI